MSDLFKGAAGGAAAGFFLPSLFGGKGGANDTPLGQIAGLLPVLMLGGGALYAIQMLKNK